MTGASAVVPLDFEGRNVRPPGWMTMRKMTSRLRTPSDGSNQRPSSPSPASMPSSSKAESQSLAVLMPREMCVGRFKAYQELLAEWLSEDTGPLFSVDPMAAPEPVVTPEPRAVAQPAKISLPTEIETRQGRLF
jgi:hypothetical protein